MVVYVTTIDALKTAEATGDLIGNKINDVVAKSLEKNKITSTALQSNSDPATQTKKRPIKIPKTRYIHKIYTSRCMSTCEYMYIYMYI